MTLCALALGLWGVISLFAACVREREMLIDSHARLDLLDRVGVREPLRAIKEATRPKRPESRRPEAHRPELQPQLEISGDVQAKLAALAQLQGRDSSELLEEMLRKQLPDFKKSRVA